MPEIFVDRGHDLLKIEGTTANKFKWFWLEEKDDHGDFFSDYVRKIPEPGIAYCLYCQKRLLYGSKGKSFIKRHANSKHHTAKRNAVKSNQSLPATFQSLRNLEACVPAVPSTSSSCPLPYGAAPNVINTASTSGETTGKITAPPSMKDRVAHQEAMVCSFIAEHTMPLSMAPELISFAKTMAKDHKALQSLAMERQTATYKLKSGFQVVLRKRLIQKLRSNYCSINLDESTTKHGKRRILNTLVCFFDFDLDKSVTLLYLSVELFTVNAETVFSALIDAFERDEIPLTNLISSLSDSAAYMRGTRKGFFARLKEVAPHILDIDADACHHIHNISKSFSSSVDPDSYVAKLLDDIFIDFKYCADLREDFLSICRLLGVKPQVPKERAGHRWLSLLDCCQRFDDLKDILFCFYFSWRSREDKDLFQHMITEVFVNKNARKEIREKVFGVMKKVQSKNVTAEGKARKLRICKKLFDFQERTSLLVSIVLSVFPLFKRFILLFEKKTPMLHVLHDEQVDLFRKFLQFFVQPEFIRESGKDLHKLDLSKREILLPAEHVFVGSCAKVLSGMDRDDVLSFKSTLLESFLSTAVYMQRKLPLNNSLLRTFSFLDPKIFGRGITAISLKKLPELLPNVYVTNFDNEIMEMQSDMDISADDCELDVWWAKVFKLGRYPSVTKIVSACLSVFTGPRVEQSLSIMNSIISEKKGSLHVSTYEAYMFCKYHLLSLGCSTLQLFDRPDSVNSPVDSSLAYHMLSASTRMNNAKNKRPGEPHETPPSKKAR